MILSTWEKATMAEAAAVPAEGAAPEGGKKTGLIAAVTFGGALLGGLAASLVVAPKIIARQQPAAAHADSAAGGEAAAEGEHGAPAEGEHGGGEGEKKFIELSNIVVNPAGSQGSRFLMLSVAISVGNEEAHKVLQDREVEMRDKVTGLVESMTLAQLTAPGVRDTLKARIAVAAGTIVGPKVPVKVFLPQFVIQ
ncbi:MAG: flagellar basal body-associated FliL family protein [Gemmatimonadetes bacterium]|nr:flagellar basal body-associated FliL family protein [Gemmatimonadota bacterium]MBK7716412.1 flagellar basal body-associated FliL family protein [Gemmatimonadota bacterium]